MAAMSDLNLERTKNSSALAASTSAKEAADATVARLTNELATYINERSKLQDEARQAKLDAERFRNQAAGKDQVVQTSTKLAEGLSSEVQTLRDRTLAAARREAELQERLAELEAQNQVLSQNVRSLQEQLSETRSAAAPASASTTSAGATDANNVTAALAAANARAGVESAGPLVSGRVRKLTRAENGEDLAFITLGSSSGLKVGQRLHIVRDGRFVASLVITVVDAAEAAGRIDRLGRSVDVLENDMVLSRVY
jgi:chromosome segregation ATPase